MRDGSNSRQGWLPGVEDAPTLDRQGGAAPRTLVEVVGAATRPRVRPLSPGFEPLNVAFPRRLRRPGRIFSVEKLTLVAGRYYRASGAVLVEESNMGQVEWTEVHECRSNTWRVSVWKSPYKAGASWLIAGDKDQDKAIGNANDIAIAKEKVLGLLAKYVKWEHSWDVSIYDKYALTICEIGDEYKWFVDYDAYYAEKKKIAVRRISRGIAVSLKAAQDAAVAAVPETAESLNCANSAQLAAGGTSDAG